MLIRVGYELTYRFEQATPMILNLNVHYTRSQDLVRPDTMVTNPAVPLSGVGCASGMSMICETISCSSAACALASARCCSNT